MYGSTWPVCLIKNSYNYVLDLAKNISSDLSIIEKEDFFFNNGFNFYK
jgi:predicted TIM-barrel fold metal-dependent hydrolase